MESEARSVRPGKTQIQEAISRNSELLDQIEISLNGLEKRLNPVLRISSPPPDSSKSLPSKQLVELAEILSVHSTKLLTDISRINDIEDRLEL